MSVSQGALTVTTTVREQDPFQEWIEKTETQEQSAQAGANVYQPFQLAVDPDSGLVVVRDLVRLEGADSKLIRDDEDLKAGRIPENHGYVTPTKLAERLDNIEGATLRRRVSRCRQILAKAYKEMGPGLALRRPHPEQGTKGLSPQPTRTVCRDRGNRS